MLGLSKRELLKSNKELLELHKRVLTTYLVQRNLKHRTIKKFFKIYDTEVTEKNILCYFHRPSSIFVKALVTDRLDQLKDMYMVKKKKIKKKPIWEENW